MIRKTDKNAAEYRIQMAVKEYRSYSKKNCFPVCPRCRCSLEMDYQSYCDRCGQALSWKKYHKATLAKD